MVLTASVSAKRRTRRLLIRTSLRTASVGSNVTPTPPPRPQKLRFDPWRARDQAKSEIFEYIELFYNRRRLHQSMAYQTPMSYDSMNVFSC